MLKYPGEGGQSWGDDQWNWCCRVLPLHCHCTRTIRSSVHGLRKEPNQNNLENDDSEGAEEKWTTIENNGIQISSSEVQHY